MLYCCNKCGLPFPFDEEYFRPYKNKVGDEILHKVCRSCECEYSRKWYATRTVTEKENVLARGRKRHKTWTAANREHIREKWLQKAYGITSTEFSAMARKQGNSCAICATPIDVSDKHSCHVDHRHADGLIRGILCSKCNRGIGFFNDDPMLLLAAAQYVST